MTDESVRYVGKFTTPEGKVFDGDFKMSRAAFEEARDHLDYVNGFAKKCIAEEIFKKVNKRSRCLS
jgi:hypothetical protein